MKSLKSYFIILSGLGMIFLGACNGSDQVAKPDTSPAGEKPAQSATPSAPAKTEISATESHSPTEWPPKGGQTVEAGKYHLQFIPEKEEKGTHLDYYFLTDNDHKPILDAKVTGQIQLPDGTQKTLDFKYDTEGKHYTVFLPSQASGQYQVKMTSELKGEKIDGRFTFNQ